MAVLTACALASPAAAADRAKLDEARSLVAEAALVETLAAQGKLTSAYADAQRQDLRRDLVKLKKEPDLAAPAQAALEALDRRDVQALQAVRDQLVAMERAHGRTG